MSATSTNRPSIVSWGELLWDIYPDEARLGGASANLAFHAAQLGCKSLLVSCVGRDELGFRALHQLKAAGVDVSGVGIDDELPTGRVRVELHEGEPRFVIEARSAWDRIACPDSLREWIRRSEAFCYGTLAQRSPLVRGVLGKLLAELPDDGGPLRVLDLNLRPPFVEPELLLSTVEGAHVVKANEAELIRLGELLDLSQSDRRDPSAWLLAQGALEVVAITRGPRGASLVTRHERIDHSGHPSTGADPVGAGDAFTAMLARELVRKSPFPALLDRACRYAAWVAAQPGGQPPVDAQVLSLVE